MGLLMLKMKLHNMKNLRKWIKWRKVGSLIKDHVVWFYLIVCGF